MMKSVLSAVLLFSLAIAAHMTPLSNTSASVYGLDSNNITETLVHRQVDPMAYGSPCSDEGAWFCMSTTFQRCASGQWTMAQDCSPGTQCEPLGLTYNASQPAFGVYDGSSSSSTVTTDASTTNPSTVSVTGVPIITITISDSQLESSLSAFLSAESTSSITPITMTRTTDITVPWSPTTTSSTLTWSATFASSSTITSTSTSTTTSTSEPKADDTSDGAHTGGFSWPMMSMISVCLAAEFWYR